MAKKKKKDTKTLKALLILVAVVSCVCIGIALGTSAYNMKQKPNGNQNTIATGVVGSVPETSEETTVVEEPVVEEPEEKPAKEPNKTPEKKPEKESEQDESSESEEKPETTNEQKEETPQGSDSGNVSEPVGDVSGLSNKKHSWSFKRNKDHKRPLAYNKFDIKPYDTYYVMNTDEKVIYLTMDAGYENGYMPMILDTLKANDVQATFFVTKPFVENNLELAKRMKEDGHIVGNHTVKHESMPTLSDERVRSEINDTEKYFEEATGYKMDKFFRPPAGEYSKRTLAITKELGYKTIFWSMAYADWDRNNQKGADYALNHVLENAHPGMIPLLHSISSSNAEALDDIIKQLKEQGYRFGSLYEVE